MKQNRVRNDDDHVARKAPQRRSPSGARTNVEPAKAAASEKLTIGEEIRKSFAGIDAPDSLSQFRFPMKPAQAASFAALIERLILDEFAPASVLINRKYEIIGALGPLTSYLEFISGEIRGNLLAMARQGLRAKIRSALRTALQSGEAAAESDARVKRNGIYVTCMIKVGPIAEYQEMKNLFLITFQDREGVETTSVEALAKPTTNRKGLYFDHLEYELRSTREELQSTVKLLAKALSHLGEGVMITADHVDWPESQILFVNDAMCQITGYTSDELIGQSPRILQRGDSSREDLDHIRQELSAGRSCRIEFVNYRKDGTSYDAELFTTPLFDDDGRRTNFVAIHQDISQRKELERHVLEIALNEQQRFGQELHDCTGQELTALSLFADALTGSLNQRPRKTSDGKATWLLDELDLVTFRQTAQKLSQGLAESKRLVQQLSRGIMPVQIEANGLRAALEELATETNGLRNSCCTFECSAPIMLANDTMATHLYRIAQEAINNSLRHSQAAHLGISLSQSETEVILEVNDDGIGFSPAFLGQIEIPERRRGIGLSIMRYRAGIIGGRLVVTRQEQGGMQIQCIIPRRIKLP